MNCLGKSCRVRLAFAGMAIGALAAAGCVSTGIDDRSESWISQPTLQTANTADWDEIPAERIHEVLPARLPDAIALLGELQVLQVTPEQAHQLGGDFRDRPSPLYLVRALGSPAQGYHRIVLASHDGKSLLVSSGILAHHTIKPERSHILISLPENPTVVYVNAFEAE